MLTTEKSCFENYAALEELEVELAAKIAGKTTIYLDTNHWVHMQGVVLGREKAKPEYAEVLSLLEDLVTHGVICCPVSSSLFEELMTQTSTRRVTAKLMDRLSQGVCLQFFLKLARREWRYNVWKVLLGGEPGRTFPVWTSPGFWAGQEDSLRHLNLWKELPVKAITVWAEQMWSIGFEGVQDLPGFVPFPNEMVAMFVASMNDATERAKAATLSFDELRSREKFGLLRVLKDDFFNEPMPKPKPDVLPTTIFSSFVDEDKPWILPPLQIFASISAAVMRSNRVIDASHALDFFHAASGIPYCDAFFCDKSMAAFFKSKPLEFDKVYDTVILSRADEIVDYLKQLGR